MGAVREELPLSLHDAASKAIDGYVDATPQSPTSVLEAGVEPQTYEVNARKGMLVREGVELTTPEVRGARSRGARRNRFSRSFAIPVRGPRATRTPR